MSDDADLPNPDEQLEACERRLKYSFRDRTLLALCLTHASVAPTRLKSNERLEFLGDAILGAVVCEILFHQFPEYPEGEMTRIKSVLVSRNTCAQVAESLHLDRFLRLGKGLRQQSEIPMSIMAGAFEAVVAGVYLDGGMDAAQQFVERAIQLELSRFANLDDAKNHKSLLQQLCQKRFGDTPEYRLLDEKGPDHAKCFKIAAVVGPQIFTAAWGPSKKEAEQRAAHNALCELENKQVPYVGD